MSWRTQRNSNSHCVTVDSFLSYNFFSLFSIFFHPLLLAFITGFIDFCCYAKHSQEFTWLCKNCPKNRKKFYETLYQSIFSSAIFETFLKCNAFVTLVLTIVLVTPVLQLSRTLFCVYLHYTIVVLASLMYKCTDHYNTVSFCSRDLPNFIVRTISLFNNYYDHTICQSSTYQFSSLYCRYVYIVTIRPLSDSISIFMLRCNTLPLRSVLELC